MAQFTVTVPFPYSPRVGGSGTSPVTITINADTERGAVSQLVGFGIPAAAAREFTFRTPTVSAPASAAEQGGLTREATPDKVLGEDITPAEGTVAGGTLGQANILPSRTEFGKSLFGLGLIQDPRGTTITPPATEQGVANTAVTDPLSIRRALADIQSGRLSDPASISDLAVRTGSGTPAGSEANITPTVDIDATESARFAAEERERQAEIRRRAAEEVAIAERNAQTGVIEPLGPQSADIEAGIAAELAKDGSLTRKEALARFNQKRTLNISAGDDADKSDDDPTVRPEGEATPPVTKDGDVGAAGKSDEDEGGGGTVLETAEQREARLLREAAAAEAQKARDASLTLSPDTLEFQRSQFMQGLRNRGLGDSGVLGQARRDAFNQANTRNIFNNVFNRGGGDELGLSQFVSDADSPLMGRGAREQAQDQFVQALNFSRGFNPAGTGFDTQGLTPLQQDILNPQSAGQAGILNNLAQQVARKKFGVGAEFLGRRNFADEFFGQDRGSANTFAEHLNNRLFGGRF